MIYVKLKINAGGPGMVTLFGEEPPIKIGEQLEEALTYLFGSEGIYRINEQTAEFASKVITDSLKVLTEQWAQYQARYTWQGASNLMFILGRLNEFCQLAPKAYVKLVVTNE